MNALNYKVNLRSLKLSRANFTFIGRTPLFRPGYLPELPSLCPVAVRRKTAKPVEVVATTVTEILQCLLSVMM